MKSILITALMLTSWSWANASLVNVTSLNQALQKKGATWTAKQTWLTDLSKDQAQRMMGLAQAPSAEVEFSLPASKNKADLPSSIDWRNKDGKNWVSPILNQANCGSCVAFASIATLETQVNISSLIPNLNVKFSPQNLFSCGGGACEMGWFPGAAAEQLMNVGVTDEACMPYTSGASGQDVACAAACPDASQRTYKISRYRTPSRLARDVNSVKQALLHGPLVTTLTVYADFMAYSSGVYTHTTGDALGGHAISIIGYDDATQSYIIRNSWGHEWGEDGFAHVSYQDVSGVGSETWSFELPATQGAVSLSNPHDYSYLSGTSNLKAASTYTNTDSLTISIFDKTGTAVWSQSCASSRECTPSFDSSLLADGKYEVQAIALNSKGEKIDISARDFFYIVNQKPSLSITAAGADGANLAQPLKDRIVFNITAKSSSVPMSSIVFHYKDASGVEKTKSADIVLENMTMGWRTNFVSNGSYEIWFVGHVQSNSQDLTVESAHQNVNVQN